MVSRILTTAAVALLALTACGDSTEPRVPTTLELDRLTLQLHVNETRTVTARIVDQHGNAFQQIPEGFQVQWSSDDESIAQVSGGDVLGVAVGSTVVTAQAGELAPVEVLIEVTSSTLELHSELSFDYAGGESGVFEIDAEFVFSAQTGPEGPEWALAFYDTGFGSQDIVAERERDDGRFDLIWFWVEGDPITEPDLVEMDDGLFLFGVSDTWLEVNQNSFVEAIYFLEDGAVTFTAVTEDRMSGEFALDMEDDQGVSVEVTSGVFDLPSLEIGAVGAPAAAPGPEELASVRDRILSLVR